MRQRDERSTRIANGKPRKMSAGGWQHRLAEIAMNHAEARVAVIEDAIARRRSGDHRRSFLGHIALDDERRRVIVCLGHWSDASRAERFVERTVQRELDGYIPVCSAARTRMTASVVSVNAERKNRHLRRISPRTIVCSPRWS